MHFTQWALLLLLVSWSLQIAGSWIQWRHYRDAIGDASRRWSDGFVGVGRSKPRLSAGAVAVLAVDTDLRVRQLRTMKGLSVFARFRPEPDADGLPLSDLARRYGPGCTDATTAKAVGQAISQIEEVCRRRR